jgi:hypothetical protein
MDAQSLLFIGLKRVVLALKFRVKLVFFTAKLTALFVTLCHILEAIRPADRSLILTDSFSTVKVLMSRKTSHRTHPLVYECKQMCSNLLWNGVEFEILWIPSHVELEGNEHPVTSSSYSIESCCF